MTNPTLHTGTMLFSPVTRYYPNGEEITFDVFKVNEILIKQSGGAVPDIKGFHFRWAGIHSAHLIEVVNQKTLGAYYLYEDDAVIIVDGPADKRLRLISQHHNLDWLLIGSNHFVIRKLHWERFLRETQGPGQAIKVTQEELDKMRHHVPLIPKPQEPMSITLTEDGAIKFLESRGYEVFTKEDWQEYLDSVTASLISRIDHEIEEAKHKRNQRNNLIRNLIQGKRADDKENRVSRGWAGTDTDNGESEVTEGIGGYDAAFNIQIKRLASDGPNEQSIPKSAPGFYRPGDEWTESSFESGASGQDEKANGETESDKG